MTDHGRGLMSVFSWLPGLQAARSYRRAWLARDVVAGVVLTTLLVPQGMATMACWPAWVFRVEGPVLDEC